MKRILPDASQRAVEIVESWLPHQLDAASFDDCSLSVRLSLSGPDGGDWNLSVDGDGLRVERISQPRNSRLEDPDIWVRLPVIDFRALFFGDEDLPIPSILSDEFVPLFSPAAEDLEAFGKLEGRIRFELLGRRHRRFSLDVAFGARGVGAGRPRTTLTVDAATCERLMAGAQNPLQALIAEQLRVEGDRSFALQVLLLCASRRRGQLPLVWSE